MLRHNIRRSSGVFARPVPAPFQIPADSPLATGWRSVVVGFLEDHGIQDVIDLVSAYAELRCRADPDNCSNAEESAQGYWALAAKRRIEENAEPVGPGRPRIESEV